MERRQTPRPDSVDGVCADCADTGTRWTMDEFGSPVLRFCPCDKGHANRVSCRAYMEAHQKRGVA